MTISTKTCENKFENKTPFTGSNGGGKKQHDLPRPALFQITANHTNIANIWNAQNTHKERNQRSCTSPIAMSPTAWSSPKRVSTISVKDFFNPRQRNKPVPPRQYFAPELSINVSSDGEYYTCIANKYGQRGNLSISNLWLKLWSRASSQLSSLDTSNNDSGIFTSGNHNYARASPDIKHQRKPALQNSKDRKYRSNLSTNIRSGRFYDKTPPRKFIANSGTHYANTKYHNASVASSLPQPPYHWLPRINRKQRSLKAGEDKNEREMAKRANTFDYYNLKKLLTVKA